MPRWGWGLLARIKELFGEEEPPPPVTRVVDADWDRSYRYFPGELTEEVIKQDQPDWTPPPGAKKDPWRPKDSLGE